MSILKSNHGKSGQPATVIPLPTRIRLPGEGHFIHTYMHDGDPLPSFEGEPKLVGSWTIWTRSRIMLWSSLNEDNKVSLFVRYIDIATGAYETKIVNKNQ